MSAETQRSGTELPEAIAAYLSAHDEHDIPTAFAQFAAGAVVLDDGHAYEGSAGVESFLRTAASEYNFTRTLLSAVESTPDTWLVTNHLEGDFPGGVIDLRYEFHLAHGLITRLQISP